MAPKSSGSSSLASSGTISSLILASSWPDCASGAFFLPPFYAADASSIPHTDYPVKLLFSKTLPTPFPSELFRIFPYKIKPSEDPEVKLLISYILWTKAELKAIVKYFPKVNQRSSQICWGI